MNTENLDRGKAMGDIVCDLIESFEELDIEEIVANNDPLHHMVTSTAMIGMHQGLHPDTVTLDSIEYWIPVLEALARRIRSRGGKGTKDLPVLTL